MQRASGKGREGHDVPSGQSWLQEWAAARETEAGTVPSGQGWRCAGLLAGTRRAGPSWQGPGSLVSHREEEWRRALWFPQRASGRGTGELHPAVTGFTQGFWKGKGGETCRFQ